MSTRRARIKAVTSLPPRRKNADGADSVKSKVQAKDEIDKPIKSPRTPRGSRTQESTEKNSPTCQPSSPLKSPRILSNTPKAHRAGQVPAFAAGTGAANERKENAAGVAKTSEKVSVITSTLNLSDSNLFRSPKSVGSPLRRPIASPMVHTKIDIGGKRSSTPDTHDNLKKITTKPAETVHEQHSNSVINAISTDNQVPDDYNVPSVPESITEDAVMDGIVPLQSVASAPKPIALLKNEIISENAEVLFDPIVPLPSPGKVRPKLRPVPRLAPLRRNSVQGSASESEDESRRALLNSGAGTPAPLRQRHDSHTSHSTLHSLPHREVNRIRNDSICSTVSQATVQPPVAASPHKEKHFTKSRRHEASRRVAALRRRREAVQRDSLTMYDLIFYNPTTNPIIPDQDELNLKAANAKEEKARIEDVDIGEDNPDDPGEQDAAPVPQIKLGPNGEIMLDEQSLVIKNSDKRKVSSTVVHEGGWAGGVSGAGGGRYRRSARTAEWSDPETVRFYRALAALGTDFMLMEPLFPGRTRRDLKLKFKKEERVNAAQVDKALRTSSKWDATRLIDEFRLEREAAERRARDDKERLLRGAGERLPASAARELRVRQSRASKALGSSILPGMVHKNEDVGLTANELIQRHTKAKAEAKKHAAELQTTPVPVNIAPKPPYATLTLINNTPSGQDKRKIDEMASILKVDPKTQPKLPENLNNAPVVPSNIETGSLVVLTVNDPNSPSKKMLQTYIAHGGGKLTPVALPTSFLNSVVTYMKKGTPKSTMSAGSSPHLTSPSSVASHDSRSCSTPGVIQMNGSPAKRQRHSSYTITQL